MNTVFALKYARLHYLETDGRLDFRHAARPTYSDFAYFAFTVGMSFATADIEPTTTQARKTVLSHALLSYLFATGVLATAINLVTNL